MFWLLLMLACRPQPSLATEGGLELVYTVNLDGVPAQRHDEAVDQVRETIARRLDAMEAHGRAGRDGDRIVVQLPGPVDSERVKAVVAEQAEITFLPQADPDTSAAVVLDLGRDAPAPIRGDMTAPAGHDPDPALGALRAHVTAVSDRVPAGMRVGFEHAEEDGLWRTLVFLDSDQLRGESISDASVGFDRATQAPYVYIAFDADGRAALEAITTAYTGEVVAIVLDDEVLYAPVIREPIRGGRLRFDLGSGAPVAEQTATLQDLVVVLRSGALRAPVRLESVRQIGPASPGSR